MERFIVDRAKSLYELQNILNSVERNRYRLSQVLESHGLYLIVWEKEKNAIKKQETKET